MSKRNQRGNSTVSGMVNPVDLTISTLAQKKSSDIAKEQGVQMSIIQLPIDRLFIEGAFQRDLRAQKVRNIVRDFDERKVNPVKVHAEPNGRYSILDGQHTTEVLNMKGYRYAPCIVFEGMLDQEKARLFRTQDDNKNRMTPYDRFRQTGRDPSQSGKREAFVPHKPPQWKGTPRASP